MNEFLRRLLFLPDPASDQAASMDTLHLVLFLATVVMVVVVMGAFGFFAWRFRRRSDEDTTREVHAPRGTEWIVGGILLASFVGSWFVGFTQYTGAETRAAEAVRVYAVGKQWVWKFTDGEGRRSAGVLVVPAGRPVEVLLASRDVIHSFSIPALRLKRDAVPGLTTSLSFLLRRPGEYPVYCAEYCGVSHSGMLATLVALDEEDYARWQNGEWPAEVLAAGGEWMRGDASYPGPLPDLVSGDASPLERGRILAGRLGCVGCHESGEGPSWRGLAGTERTLADGRRVVADSAYLSRAITEPGAEIATGWSNTMPTYQGLIDEEDVAALVAYIESVSVEARPR